MATFRIRWLPGYTVDGAGEQYYVEKRYFGLLWVPTNIRTYAKSPEEAIKILKAKMSQGEVIYASTDDTKTDA